MEINIAICDDMEEFNRALSKHLKSFATNINHKFNIKEYTSGSILINDMILGYIPDIVFLDIELNELFLGTDFGIKIKEINPNILLIYVSSYNKYDKRIIKSEPFDFLSKPIRINDFNKTLQKALSRLSYFKNDYLYKYKSNGVIFQINLKEVLCFESEHRTVNIIMLNQEDKNFYGKLDDVEEEVCGIYDYFIRVNKSYLVNYIYLEKISQNVVTLHGGINVKISNKYRQNLLQKIYMLSNK